MRTLGDSNSGSGGAGGRQGDNGGKGGGGVHDLGDLILSAANPVATAPANEVPGTAARLMGDCRMCVTLGVDVSVPAPVMTVGETKLTSLVAESRAGAGAPLSPEKVAAEKPVGSGGTPGI